ncbi:MAG: alpha/beta fold hydrolase [Candidatus Helarchaeota archaeon]
MIFSDSFIREQLKQKIFKKYAESEVLDYFKRLTKMREEIIGTTQNLKVVESYFESIDNLMVYYKYWEPYDKPEKIVIMLHGLNCHSDLYYPLADYFYDKKVVLSALDIRGHGRTGHIFGNMENINKILADINILIKILKKKYQIPIFLMGESLGSLLILNYACEKPFGIKGVITLAPGIRPHGYDIIKLIYPLLLPIVLIYYPLFNIPFISIPSGGENPTYFPSFNDYDSNDILHVKKLSLRTILNLVRLFKNTLKRITDKFTTPIFICQGTGDNMVDYRGALELFNKINIKDKKIKFYKNANHSLLYDMNSKNIYNDIILWLKDH